MAFPTLRRERPGWYPLKGLCGRPNSPGRHPCVFGVDEGVQTPYAGRKFCRNVVYVRSLQFLLCGVAIAALSACHKPTEAAADSERRPDAPAVAQTPGVVTL